MKLAEPCGIAYICFSPRHVLGVTRIDQNDLEPVLPIAAAPTLTGFNSGRSQVLVLVITNPPSKCGKGLGYAIFIFLIGITVGAASPLSSSHEPMDHVFQRGLCLQ